MNASGSETELGHKKKDQVKTFNSFSFFGYALISYHPIFISTVTETHTEAYTVACKDATHRTPHQTRKLIFTTVSSDKVTYFAIKSQNTVTSRFFLSSMYICTSYFL